MPKVIGALRKPYDELASFILVILAYTSPSRAPVLSGWIPRYPACSVVLAAPSELIKTTMTTIGPIGNHVREAIALKQVIAHSQDCGTTQTWRQSGLAEPCMDLPSGAYSAKSTPSLFCTLVCTFVHPLQIRRNLGGTD